MRRGRASALACALVVAAAQGASAGHVLDRVKAEGVVRCGASARPGFAAAGEDRITGLAVDLCRAVAVAVLGPRGRVEFRLYAAPRDWGATTTRRPPSSTASR